MRMPVKTNMNAVRAITHVFESGWFQPSSASSLYDSNSAGGHVDTGSALRSSTEPSAGSFRDSAPIPICVLTRWFGTCVRESITTTPRGSMGGPTGCLANDVRTTCFHSITHANAPMSSPTRLCARRTRRNGLNSRRTAVTSERGWRAVAQRTGDVAGDAQRNGSTTWDRDFFHSLGLVRLRGTVQYPERADRLDSRRARRGARVGRRGRRVRWRRPLRPTAGLASRHATGPERSCL